MFTESKEASVHHRKIILRSSTVGDRIGHGEKVTRRMSILDALMKFVPMTQNDRYANITNNADANAGMLEMQSRITAALQLY
jgi:hypothetical protein